VLHVFPSSGPMSGGTKLNIGGLNFDGESIRCLIGTHGNVVATTISSTLATCITPVSPESGPLNIGLNIDEQNSTNSGAIFSYEPAPTIASLSPTLVSSTTNNAVTIFGSNLGGTSCECKVGNDLRNTAVKCAQHYAICSFSMLSTGNMSVSICKNNNDFSNALSLIVQGPILLRTATYKAIPSYGGNVM